MEMNCTVRNLIGRLLNMPMDAEVVVETTQEVIDQTIRCAGHLEFAVQCITARVPALQGGPNRTIVFIRIG